MLRADGYKKWYFTFGCGQEHAGYCQPIYAKSSNTARKKMFDSYGNKWSWQYDEEDWIGMRNSPNRAWPMETELEPIVVKEEEENE